MERKKSRPKDDRTRNWTFILYPESAPPNWRDVLDDKHISWIESPLHDKDDNPDGEQKKPHKHILLLFEGKKSYEQIKEITDELCATIPQKAASAMGLVRYMAHLDNPEKHQYSISEIIGHGGADVAEYLKPTKTVRYSLIREMMNFVEDNDITEFIDLAEHARNERFDDWFPLLCDNSAYIMELYIKSKRHGKKRIDGDTGEVY